MYSLRMSIIALYYLEQLTGAQFWIGLDKSGHSASDRGGQLLIGQHYGRALVHNKDEHHNVEVQHQCKDTLNVEHNGREEDDIYEVGDDQAVVGECQAETQAPETIVVLKFFL